MKTTPNSNRLHVILLGKRNSGKSSLLNALTNQEVSLVSDVAGTTTDPVYKPMELHGIGAVNFIDTAGFDDKGELGLKRVAATKKAIQKADVALMVCSSKDIKEEARWMQYLEAKSIPCIVILNKIDVLDDPEHVAQVIERRFKKKPFQVSALEGIDIESIRKAILEAKPSEYERQTIVGKLANDGDVVLLVMPQDLQAPKGRLILPQVQTIRDLLDKRCVVISCTTDRLEVTLKALVEPPHLIITDSQAFNIVMEQKSDESALTSFSVLFANYKGDIQAYLEGAKAIAKLSSTSKVLIAEACTHAPLAEDIGREKIPLFLKRLYGETLGVDVVAGTNFPEDLSSYDLVIHCGACMFNRKYVLNRIEQCRKQGIPITNYGVCLAYLHGILEHIVVNDA